MPKMVTLLKVDVSVSTEERKDERGKIYFAATTEPFAITVYGKTEDEAQKTAIEGVRLLVNAHSKTPEDADNYLNCLKVKHIITQQKVPEYRPRISSVCTRELDIEVPVAA